MFALRTYMRTTCSRITNSTRPQFAGPTITLVRTFRQATDKPQVVAREAGRADERAVSSRRTMGEQSPLSQLWMAKERKLDTLKPMGKPSDPNIFYSEGTTQTRGDQIETHR